MSAQYDLPQEAPPPDKLMDLLMGTVSDPMLKLPILRAGIELEVWARIGSGCKTAGQIASSAGADLDGMRCLLDALAVMKLLEKDASGYSLPAWAEYYLLPGRPTYLGGFVLEWLAWERHGQLAEAIRTGKRPIIPDVTHPDSMSYFIPIYAARALTPRRSLKRYEGYWHALQVTPRDGLRMIDLACGGGIASFALALQHPGVGVTLLDWPAMLKFAVDAAQKLGVERQITLIPGDMFSVDFGSHKFDIARLGFVTYFFGPEDLIRLFHKVHAALAADGILVIQASLSDEGHCESEDAVVDGPWLYAISPRGSVYSFLDYKSFLEQAGFESIIQVRDDLIKASV